MVSYEQGDILKVEGIKQKLLVLSNNQFNTDGLAMCCPLLEKSSRHPLHIDVSDIVGIKFVANVELTKMIDISTRGFSVISRISCYDVMNVSDALQGLFEY